MAVTKQSAAAQRVAVENINVPGKTHNVDAGKYHAMKVALLEVLPGEDPGLTQQEMMASVVPYLPETLFPGGAKAGWWVKTVQLDLEAKGVILRDTAAKPLRWRRV